MRFDSLPVYTLLIPYLWVHDYALYPICPLYMVDTLTFVPTRLALLSIQYMMYRYTARSPQATLPSFTYSNRYVWGVVVALYGDFHF